MATVTVEGDDGLPTPPPTPPAAPPLQRYYDNFRERGYNEHAAQAMAVESLEGGEEPRESIRFAGIYGE